MEELTKNVDNKVKNPIGDINLIPVSRICQKIVLTSRQKFWKLRIIMIQ